jgi:hypothetical protein
LGIGEDKVSVKWEYKAWQPKPSKPFSMTEVLNTFGQDRWELVLWDRIESLYIFKRPVEKNTDEDSKI